MLRLWIINLDGIVNDLSPISISLPPTSDIDQLRSMAATELGVIRNNVVIWQVRTSSPCLNSKFCSLMKMFH